MRTLYGLSQSPWTHRARWALDHHAVTYRYREHVPLLGEPLLRRRAKTDEPSVPLLLDGDRAVMGALEIARHADAIGRGPSLFPRREDADIIRWSALSDEMSAVGRAWVMKSLRDSREAQSEALPSFLPGPLRTLLAPTARLGVAFLVKKYGVPSDVDAEIARVFRPALEEVRTALAGNSYLLGTFSYADVAVACALTAVRPDDRAPLGPGTRAVWTNEALASEFDDLLMWRDALVGKHR